jgi:hypothetical protein
LPLTVLKLSLTNSMIEISANSRHTLMTWKEEGKPWTQVFLHSKVTSMPNWMVRKASSQVWEMNSKWWKIKTLTKLERVKKSQNKLRLLELRSLREKLRSEIYNTTYRQPLPTINLLKEKSKVLEQILPSPKNFVINSKIPFTKTMLLFQNGNKNALLKARGYQSWTKSDKPWLKGHSTWMTIWHIWQGRLKTVLHKSTKLKLTLQN